MQTETSVNLLNYEGLSFPKNMSNDFKVWDLYKFLIFHQICEIIVIILDTKFELKVDSAKFSNTAIQRFDK